MICKEGKIDVISINGSSSGSSNHHNPNGHNTLQHRRKSQLITFSSSSSCDIKNSLSHEVIILNNGNNSNGARNSIIGSSSIHTPPLAQTNTRLSFAEEDLVILANDRMNNGSFGKHGSISSAQEAADLEPHFNDDINDDDVFRRRSLEVDDEGDLIFDDVYGTHIDNKSSNANDDSGGGSYEDSHAFHSSLGGSNRNSLEKDDDIDDVDVISTDVSCYDQLLGSSCNTRNGDAYHNSNDSQDANDDNDDIATLIGDNDGYGTTKLVKNHKKTVSKNGANIITSTTTPITTTTTNTSTSTFCSPSENNSLNGGRISYMNSSTNNGAGNGYTESNGVIYANPFMDDEGIAESGM